MSVECILILRVYEKYLYFSLTHCTEVQTFFLINVTANKRKKILDGFSAYINDHVDSLWK